MFRQALRPRPRPQTIGQILAMFGKVDATLAASASKIWFRTEDEANI
jgi:hypothetical protein